MTAPQTDATTDPQSIIAALRQQLKEQRAERDAALAREATLANELAARTAALAQRNTEYRERIEHQAATVDVLKMMLASPDDPQPVFDLIARQARDQCNSANAGFYEYDGMIHFRSIASHALSSDAIAAYARQFPMSLEQEPNNVVAVSIRDRRIVHFRDPAEGELTALARSLGTKSGIVIPLIRGDATLGCIAMSERRTGGFTDSQVELLKTFAEQAVIAITSAETYRALQTRTSDLQESLEYQTATSDVLKVISRSAFDLQPVLDTVVETAAKLCVADMASIGRREGEAITFAANYGFPPEYETNLKARGPVKLDPASPAVGQRTLIEGRPVHVDDAAAVPGYPEALIRLGKHRTTLGVPLLRDGETIGVIQLARQRVEPFTDRQIELASTFADQAVIAIENTRLLNEQREALEQQTATAEVLQVINASPGNLAPVFEAVLKKALRLCEATFGLLLTYDGECFHLAAQHEAPAAFLEFWKSNAPIEQHGGGVDRLLETKHPVQTLDVKEGEGYRTGTPISRALVDLAGGRTLLAVPFLKDGAVVGAILIYRREVRTFSDKQIALLENFAAQAVIAMENARLITETREALEQQTATAEVLQLINSSPDDLTPVFDAILEKAHSLCGAPLGSLVLRDGDQLRAVATRGYPEEYEALARQGFPPTPSFKSFLSGEPFVHVLDGSKPPTAFEDHPMRRAAAEISGVRTVLFVPLRKDETVLGYISAQRQEVRPFTDRQIALLGSFAEQAVIAMENARLIAETREALEQQTATAEVLQVINTSPGDLAPVFDAMLEKATRLCQAEMGAFWTYDGEKMHVEAIRGASEQFAEFLKRGPHGLSPGQQQLRHGERIVHVVNITEGASYRSGDPLVRAAADLGGINTILVVPLRKDGALLGTIGIYRQEVRPFLDKQIALLQNFAAQAVIAMENARLLTETREALEQQTATAEVLGVINASPGELAPVFDAMLEKAMRLCGAAYGVLRSFDGERAHLLASRGVPSEYAGFLARNAALGTPPAGTDFMRALQTGQPTQTMDARESVGYRNGAAGGRAIADLGGARTVLHVPLVKDLIAVGLFTMYRQEVRGFSDKQIALLQNFAAQAVIAMENARLLTETREALEQQTAMAEVLQVINSSPGNVAPVFEAILEKAHTLCGATLGSLISYDGEFFHRLAAHGYPPEYEALIRTPFRPLPYMQRLLDGERFIHDADLAVTPSDNPFTRTAVESVGIRTALFVPLRKDGTLLGYISAQRREVRPFSPRQIALIENFAAQAVIAMENARLITETREALEQQIATAEVLQVINANPGNLAPVFDTILNKAHALCGATMGNLTIYKDGYFQILATHGHPEEIASLLRQPFRPNPTTQGLIDGARFHQIEDIKAIEISSQGPILRPLVAQTDVRTALFVPLRKDEALLGLITAHRPEVRPFSEKEIALLENFGAQAVIAMENARLLNEQREALEQQTATAEVLQVINASPGDLAPVFDAMLEKAMRLCGAAFGSFYTYDGEQFLFAAQRGLPKAFAEFRAQNLLKPVPGSQLARAIENRQTLQVLDLEAGDLYREGNPFVRAMVDLGGVRTILTVPLCKDETVLGLLSVYRQEVRAFSDRQIELLENFAAQAVIAMENARLLEEVRQRQQELRITFENMGDGVAMFDESQRLVAWNGKFREMFDLPAALFEQNRTYEEHLRFLAARGDFGTGVETAEQIDELVATTGQPYGYERRRPDGRVIEIRRNPVPDGGFVLIFSDITERMRSEAEIRAARDAAEEASRTIEAAYRDLKAAQANLIQAEKMASLGQLTAGIAHEIKNPLNFVNNFASLSVDLLDELKQTAAPGFAMLDETRRVEIDDLTRTLSGNLEKINEHGNRADGIVRSMLEHSRGSSGERRSIDLNVLVEEALNLAYHGARAQDQSFNITLQRDFGESIASITVVPQDVTRVLLNLFSNGFYAARRRQGTETVHGFEPTLMVATRELGEAVEIRVRDNGIGIPEEIRDKLFQPFFTTKPTGEGTGLGLSISYDIITQQHGGSITVESEPGSFTEFTVRLPRQ